MKTVGWFGGGGAGGVGGGVGGNTGGGCAGTGVDDLEVSCIARITETPTIPPIVRTTPRMYKIPRHV